MGIIKDRAGMDLTEVEDTKKRWQEYTEELWTEVCDTVNEAGTKTISKKKEMQNGKTAVWGGLTNSWEEKRS